MKTIFVAMLTELTEIWRAALQHKGLRVNSRETEIIIYPVDTPIYC